MIEVFLTKKKEETTMKNLTKKLIAIIMTMLMVAALLPVTASADQNAIIIVELNEPYYGENLNEILPEIKIEVAYSFIDGYAFIVYYDHTSDEDAYAAAAALAANPRVKSAAYCPGNVTEQTSRVAFHVNINTDYFGGYYGISEPELAKLFPGVEIKKASRWSYRSYDLFFDISSTEEWYELYDELNANPFIQSVNAYDMGNAGKYITIGKVAITTKAEHTVEEIVELYSGVGVFGTYASYSGHYFGCYISGWTLRSTLEAAKKFLNDPDISRVEWSEDPARPMVVPTEVEEAKFAEPERAEVTVATALSALRIAADLSEVKNGVYDYKLADAIWQFDCDGDKEITVSDALKLLRKAAGLA